MNRIIGLLLLVVSVAGGGAWMFYQQFLQLPLAVPAAGMVYQVPKGASLRRVAADLHAGGVLSQPELLYWHARWQGDAHRIRAGEYRLEPGMTPDALLALLVSGQTISYRLTLVEGWSFHQVLMALAAEPALEQTLVGLSDTDVMQRLGYPNEHPEGRFFPDTYAFERGTSDIDFLRRAYQKMRTELAAAWTARAADVPLNDPYQALILASIVEKETGAAGERPQIAGVFVRRLRKGMKLQTDPTVIYGMGAQFDGNIRRRDLQQDTPYNTYVHVGLPPTPICMPGRAALDAALNPADGDALYFVARGDGTHEFSARLEEHNAAVRKFQLRR